jgi:hypothetical protein
MKTIIIKNEFSDDNITRAAGERLRHIILDATRDNGQIEIDFSDTVIASTSFFDEGFAKLAEHGWTEEMLLSRITLKNIHHKDEEILREMFKNRLRGNN